MPEIKNMQVIIDSYEVTITIKISYDIRFLQSEVFSRNLFIEQITLVDIKLGGEEEILTLHSELAKPSLAAKKCQHTKTFPRSFLFKDDLSFREQQVLQVVASLRPFYPEECKVLSELFYL